MGVSQERRRFSLDNQKPARPATRYMGTADDSDACFLYLRCAIVNSLLALLFSAGSCRLRFCHHIKSSRNPLRLFMAFASAYLSVGVSVRPSASKCCLL
jgi:hypothetical protein